MILAAAIKVKLKNTGKEVVMCGARHGDIFVQEEALGLRPSDVSNSVQGFITHKGEFLTREQAFDHASECGQLCMNIQIEKPKTYGKKLISEDLW